MRLVQSVMEMASTFVQGVSGGLGLSLRVFSLLHLQDWTGIETQHRLERGSLWAASLTVVCITSTPLRSRLSPQGSGGRGMFVNTGRYSG